MNTLHIDGSVGEGGGQVLRTALSLAIVLRQPLSITRIRAGRAKPGLMRQHLAAVKAAQAISAADVCGAALGSSELHFVPHASSAGSHHIDIGSAGSAGLVLQTVLPPLLRADGPSRIAITGGTHNMLAPSTCFLQRCFLPQLAKMGASVTLEVVREGLFPAGGGQIVVQIEPISLVDINYALVPALALPCPQSAALTPPRAPSTHRTYEVLVMITSRFSVVTVIALLWLSAALPYPFATVILDTVRHLNEAAAVVYSGDWPLRGPVLNNVFHLGPGWFYVLAVPLGLTGSVPATLFFIGCLAGSKFLFAYLCGWRLHSTTFGLLWAVGLAFPGWSALSSLIVTHICQPSVRGV